MKLFEVNEGGGTEKVLLFTLFIGSGNNKLNCMSDLNSQVIQ